MPRRSSGSRPKRSHSSPLPWWRAWCVASSIWMTLMRTFRLVHRLAPVLLPGEQHRRGRRSTGVAARRAVGATVRAAVPATLRLRHRSGAGREVTQRHAVHAIRQATTSRRLVVHFMITVRLSVAVHNVIRHAVDPISVHPIVHSLRVSITADTVRGQSNG